MTTRYDFVTAEGAEIPCVYVYETADETNVAAFYIDEAHGLTTDLCERLALRTIEMLEAEAVTP